MRAHVVSHFLCRWDTVAHPRNSTANQQVYRTSAMIVPTLSDTPEQREKKILGFLMFSGAFELCFSVL